MSSNVHAELGRTRKVSALYGALAATGYTADQAADFPEDARRIVATLAGVNPPTDGNWIEWGSWDQAVAMLRRHGDLASITAKALDRLRAG